MNRTDLAVSDRLYQQPEAADGCIVLVGIDQRALEELGPFHQWSRDVFAQAIEYLNQSENRPAVICLDVLFTGEAEAEADSRLAQAAGRYGNVVTACAASIGAALVDNGHGDFDLDASAVTAFDEPYSALKEAAGLGHINAMQDSDGILRHHMLYLDLPDGRRIPSMALVAAERYQQVKGLPPLALPTVNGRGFWYLPFCGTPGSFSQSISVIDLLNESISPEFFADKIVLIGPYASGLQDSYMTAVDRAQPMYGVEYQANAIQALLWGAFPREISNRLQLAVLFVLLLAAEACFWRRSVKWSTILWALFCGGWVLFCLRLRDWDWLLHVLWVPMGITVLYVGCIALNYVQAALERQKAMRTFQRYVAPEIVSELMSAGPSALELGGKKCDIAVLFVDIRGFTTMSEHLTPEKIVEILNQYLTLTTKCIMDSHGTLDKFVGDCTMAFWNAPLSQDDYIMLACRAAMAMAEGAKPLTSQLMREYGHTVSFGIGIHTGPAVVGNIGAPMRMDYTAIGDTVNTAARLEANAPGGTIYISRAVADALAGRIRATSLGSSIKLKGKADGFEVLTLDEILE